MENFAVLRHPVTVLVTDLTNPNNLTNDLLIFNALIICQDLGQSMSTACKQLSATVCKLNFK